MNPEVLHMSPPPLSIETQIEERSRYQKAVAYTASILGAGAIMLGLGAQAADAKVERCGPNTPQSELPVLSSGDTGPCVGYHQNLLVRHKDLKSYEADGVFGANTRGRTIGFQISNDVRAGNGQLGTGVVAEKTWLYARKAKTNQGLPKVCRDIKGKGACTSLEQGLTRLIQNGKIVKVMPSSSGMRESAAYRTDEGVHKVLWKVYNDRSRIFNNAPMPRAVYYTPGGEAFHAGSLYVRSHGCIHLRFNDANSVYSFLGIGSRVVNY